MSGGTHRQEAIADHRAGIRIAIDDSELTSSHRDPLLVRSTIDLAHALEMEVTAEGVESPSALALLKVMGCDLIQGFLVARPMPIAELVDFLNERRHLANVGAAGAGLLRSESYW